MSDLDRGESGFLSRWSERKLQVRQGQEPADPPGSADVVPPEMGDERPGSLPEEAERLLTDADMPPLESLDAQSDYSGFLSRGVSEALRRKALAKLFSSPHLNVVDGLDDYAEDFTKFAPLGNIVTADMRYRMEQAAKRLLDESESEQKLARGTDEPEDQSQQAPQCEVATDLDQEPTKGEAPV